MPSHYLYQCQSCSYRARRYRNIKNCPKCHGKLKRLEEKCTCCNGAGVVPVKEEREAAP